MYAQNYKALLKEIFKNLSKWKNILYSWIGRVNIVMLTILSKLTNSKQSLSKYQLLFFAEIHENDSKIHRDEY